MKDLVLILVIDFVIEEEVIGEISISDAPAFKELISNLNEITISNFVNRTASKDLLDITVKVFDGVVAPDGG